MHQKCNVDHIDNTLAFFKLVSNPQLLKSLSPLFYEFIHEPPLDLAYLGRSLICKIMLNMKFSVTFSTIHIPRVLWNRTCHTESKECRFIFQNYYQIKIFVIAKPKLKLRNYIWNMYVCLFWQFVLCIRCKL